MSNTTGKLRVDPLYPRDIQTNDGALEIACTADSVLVGGIKPSGTAQRENARRLVACWNACDGISTEDLEASGVQIKAA